MINYNNLKDYNPTVYTTITNSLNQTIKLVEHPILGDHTEVIAMCDELKLADYTGFFDTEDMTDSEYHPKFINGKLIIGE